MSRIVDFDRGRVMVVTDLHGAFDAYSAYRDRFLALRAAGLADVLVVCGDFIHSDGPEAEDGSLAIVRDILRLRRELGPETVWALLGNHEMPHLYGAVLARGERVYTPRFERALGEYRTEVLAFFDTLPFYARSRAGVCLAHAGASRVAATPDGLHWLANYSHAAVRGAIEKLLDRAGRVSLRAGVSKLSGTSYAEMVAQNFGVTDHSDPRYDDLLRGMLAAELSEDFKKLWEVLFNQNEAEYGQSGYAAILNDFLKAMSAGYAPQTALVCGHKVTPRGGWMVVAERQLRLSSWAHARPPQAGHYLLFDAGRPVMGVAELLAENVHPLIE